MDRVISLGVKEQQIWDKITKGNSGGAGEMPIPKAEVIIYDPFSSIMGNLEDQAAADQKLIDEAYKLGRKEIATLALQAVSEVADYFSRIRYTTLEEARGTIGEAGDYRHADQILALIKQDGYVKKIGEIREIPRGGAADSEAYIADGVGISWERTADVFRQFKAAGYVQVEQ